MLQLDAADVVNGPDVLGRLDAAVAAGATAVVLQDSAAGAATLYEASLKVQGLLRGRAPLLLLDRTDIAAAINADGVLLSTQGEYGCLASVHWCTRGDPHYYRSHPIVPHGTGA
jgi:thiamine monophosphate synthase